MTPKTARRFLKRNAVRIAKHNIWCRYRWLAIRYKQSDKFIQQVRECTRILLAEGGVANDAT